MFERWNLDFLNPGSLMWRGFLALPQIAQPNVPLADRLYRSRGGIEDYVSEI